MGGIWPQLQLQTTQIGGTASEPPLPRFFTFVFACLFFPNVAIHLFDPFDPTVFPPLWVTDMQGEMCVCCCVQAGCYCHQEQSHLLPTTPYATDRTGKSPERRLLLGTHSHTKHKNIINTRVVLRDPTDEKTYKSAEHATESV